MIKLILTLCLHIYSWILQCVFFPTCSNLHSLFLGIACTGKARQQASLLLLPFSQHQTTQMYTTTKVSGSESLLWLIITIGVIILKLFYFGLGLVKHHYLFFPFLFHLLFGLNSNRISRGKDSVGQTQDPGAVIFLTVLQELLLQSRVVSYCSGDYRLWKKLYLAGIQNPVP